MVVETTLIRFFFLFLYRPSVVDKLLVDGIRRYVITTKVRKGSVDSRGRRRGNVVGCGGGRGDRASRIEAGGWWAADYPARRHRIWTANSHDGEGAGAMGGGGGGAEDQRLARR